VCIVFIGRCAGGCSGHGWCLTENSCRSVNSTCMLYILILVFISNAVMLSFLNLFVILCSADIRLCPYVSVSFIDSSHRRHRQDKNVLSCPRRRCKHNCRQDKTVLSCLDPLSMSFVSSGPSFQFPSFQ